MNLLREYLKKELDELNRQNIRLGVIGRTQGSAKAGVTGFAERFAGDPSE